MGTGLDPCRRSSDRGLIPYLSRRLWAIAAKSSVDARLPKAKDLRCNDTVTGGELRGNTNEACVTATKDNTAWRQIDDINMVWRTRW